jgi:hypothetical protein
MTFDRYFDGNGLMAPHTVPPRMKRGSDNGPLFTSQYLLLTGIKEGPELQAIYRCIDSNGTLHRAPDDPNEDAPDDHYGVLALAVKLGDDNLRVRLNYKLWHPMLLYLRAMIKPRFCRLFSPIAGLIIALSNLNESYWESSNKMLTWTMILGLEGKSFFVTLGSRIWKWRMEKMYAELGDIAAEYFPHDHPILEYWRSNGQRAKQETR